MSSGSDLRGQRYLVQMVQHSAFAWRRLVPKEFQVWVQKPSLVSASCFSRHFCQVSAYLKGTNHGVGTLAKAKPRLTGPAALEVFKILT